MTSKKRKTKKRTSGKHVSPRRHLSASPEQFAEWDAAARGYGGTWAEWARDELDRAALIPRETRETSL